MSDESWGFAPPAFKPEEALQRLRRDLRDLGLSEREGRWERGGLLMAQLLPHPDRIEARRVKRPSRNSPEWVVRDLKSSADVRDFASDLRQQLAHWSNDHD
ncbi:MAG: hypothetical protein EBS47_05050 [Betaproteobacteria bacterium]|nr:hypothetical protein [Betaproteobacteria bacterium]NBT10329.1 hypothetical protein [Betaproteobacteria bacterium]NBU49464.1 hypothetical protein [Betaproteobacteria bacterium]NBX95948.1 hypothetical protein [Betaproteobacteria bacterium]